MKITGIICEYNPLHLGHAKQLNTIRSLEPDGGIVCVMSGNYVQRGKPAIVDKSLRAKAAIECGADLVLELPVTAALSSAEGFAAEGVRILGSFCNALCFGAENAHKEALMETASALLSEAFSAALSTHLSKGLSFPAARQAALEELGVNSELVQQPNNILAVEYCKAILSQKLSMEPMPILRQGGYHDLLPDEKNPSATAVRTRMEENGDWQSYVPEVARKTLSAGKLHTLSSAEGAILAKLRTMTDEEFAALPYGSEGLWRKLMHASRKEASLEEILTSVKSKRYTRSRLDRMVLCAFLGLTEQDISQPAPYCRVLAFNDRGREILRLAREQYPVFNTGEKIDHSYQSIETRCGRLYGLFAADGPEPPDVEAARRVYYHKA